MKKITLSILFCCAFFFFINAQEAKITVSVSADSILMDNYFEVKFTLENIDANTFEPPTFRDFELVSGPNTSTSFSSMNGQTTQSTSYSYYLRPKDIGNYYIQAASVQYGDSYLETEPLEILVVPNPDGIVQKPKSQQQQSPFGDFDSFFRSDSFFGDFFSQPNEDAEGIQKQLEEKMEDLQKKLEEQQQQEKPKKKRKTYRI